MPLYDSYGRPLEREEREDAWSNPQTGLGVWGLDKTKAATYLPPWRVLDPELTALYNGSDIAAKIVSKRPEEMFRRGFEVEADNVSASETDDVREYATENLEIEQNLREGRRWGRLYGGCLAVLGIDDGRNPWEPLDEENIRSFNSISLVDRRYSYVQSQYAAMNGPRYGKPEIYLISNAVAGYGWSSFGAQKIEPYSFKELGDRGAQVSLVHESRVLRFDGNPADIVTRQNLAGWSWSVLQRVYDAMQQFDGAFDAAGYLLSDANQGVLKLQGLVKAISAGQRAALSARLQMLDQTRSVLRTIALDAGDASGKGAESFERTPTQFAGIPDLLDRMMLRMAAAADMPATELFGRAPAGLNATGEADTRKWYDTIESEQKNELGPQVRRVYRLLALAKKGPLKGRDVRWTVHFKPLWAPTDKEMADTREANARRDQIYIETGVVKPEEVAVDLFDVYPNLDIQAREEVLAAGLMFDPYENEPAPETAAGIAAQGQGEPLSPKAPVPLMGTSGTHNDPGTFPPVEAGVASSQGAAGRDPGSKAAPKGKTKPQPKDRKRPINEDAWHESTHHRNEGGRFLGSLEERSDARDDDAAILVLDALMATRSDAKEARAVFQQLLEDYPVKKLGWVLGMHWEGPLEIPTKDIDSSSRDKWAASHDGKLESFKDKIQDGTRKPAILVKTPGKPKYTIVDGHHRFLGHEALGMPLLAYVADVHVDHGPWDQLHASQKRGRSGVRSGSWTVPGWHEANAPKTRKDGGVAYAGELVETPYGPARVEHTVSKSGAHVLVARAEPAGDKGDGETRVRIPKDDLTPAGFDAAEQRAHHVAQHDSRPREQRAAAHALALTLREHAAKLRSKADGGDWDESQHPRDEDGRFGVGGGGESSGKGEGGARGSGPRGGFPSQPQGHAEGARTWSEQLPAGLTHDQTWKTHFSAHPDKGGKPTEERRREVHDPIIEHDLNVPPAAKGEQKVAIMTMGGPASGKSSGLANIDTSRFVRVDPDSIKERLPEYQHAVANRDNTYKGAAAMVHEESSAVAKEILRRGIENGNHLIVDGTGKDADSFTRKMNALKAAGYRVHVVMSHLDKDTGFTRAKDRAEKTGRYVPDEVIHEAYEVIPKNFERIARSADSFRLIDNTGTKGRPVWEGAKGRKDKIHDPAFVDAFRRQHKS